MEIARLCPTSIQITLKGVIKSHNIDSILHEPLYTVSDSTGSILFRSSEPLSIGKSYEIRNGIVKVVYGFMVLMSKPYLVVESGDYEGELGKVNYSRIEYCRI